MRRRLLVVTLAAAAALSPGPPVEGEAAPALEPEVAWIASDAPALGWGEVPVGTPPALEPLRPQGLALFSRHCAACHGGGGRGDGPFAADLVRRPRDLVAAPLRTRSADGIQADLFRTVTAGAPLHGMPSFGHLPAEQRWALVAHVLARRDPTVDAAVAPVPAQVAADAALGASTFAARCATCHGADGDGRGPLAAGLVDTPPTDFGRGPAGLRGGARLEDLARTVHAGRPGTPMVPVPLTPAELWSVAAHVRGLVTRGAEARAAAWSELFRARRALGRVEGGRREPERRSRWSPKVAERFAVAPDGRTGCLACHGGIAPIASGTMDAAIDAFAGGHPDRACAVCHEGRPDAATKAAAHEGFVANPGSLWAVGLGLGCGKCHSDRDALTSLAGLALPEPRGGGLMSVRSRKTDPTGASGANHAYRMQRALMAQETGKVFLATASVGLVTTSSPRYTDFPVDDPDGPVPCAGSPAYREHMARAERAGVVKRLDRGEGLPAPAAAAALLGGDQARGAYVDYFRKECARCHLWGEGKASTGEHRSSGCSACHVLNDQRHLAADSGDPTVPPDRPGHALRHTLVLAIPESQCNHCHTRGQDTLHSDAHQVAGMGCVDCHTSIDVHGDGNLYPSIPHQLEVRCEDCHGTPAGRPWDLPLFHGTRAAGSGPRGTLTLDGRTHLLTSRGNAKSNWLREGDQAVVVSFESGRRHVVPLLPARAPAAPAEAWAGQKVHAAPVAAHERLACATCHGTVGPKCGSCHITYFAADKAQDWLASAFDYDPATTRQRPVLTPGAVDFKDMGGMTWGTPDFRPDPHGKVEPRIPGCRVSFTWLGPRGERAQFESPLNPGRPGYPPPVAPSLPHELSLSPRTCAECHPDGPGRPARDPPPRLGGSDGRAGSWGR